MVLQKHWWSSSAAQEPLLRKNLCLSWSDKRMFPDWASGVGSLWTRGDHSDHGSQFTTWTPSIPVAWCPGSWIFLSASNSAGSEIWTLSSPAFPLKIAIPSLFVCFLWWLILALWDRYFLIFPNITSKSLPRGWLISLYQLSKVTRLRDDIWRKPVIRLEIWSLQLRCFCNTS